MQAYNAKLTISPYYVESLFSPSPILRGYQDKNRKKHIVSGPYKPIVNAPRSRYSYLRAKKRLRFAIASNIDTSNDLSFWSYTFSPIHDKIAKNETNARRYFRNFMQRLRRISGLDLKYVAIAEKQKKSGRNAWHFHVLFFNLTYYPHAKMSQIWNAGFVFVRSRETNIQSVQHLINYMSKYLTKDTDVGRSKKLFWGSRNLVKPLVLYDKPFDFSDWELYSSSEVVYDDKTTYLLKTYFHKHAISNKSSKTYPHRKVRLC